MKYKLLAPRPARYAAACLAVLSAPLVSPAAEPNASGLRFIDPGPPGDKPAAPPSDAIVLFDGKDLSRWKGRRGEPGWKVEDGAMTVVPGAGDLITKDAFGDIQLHFEWRIPAGVQGAGEGRGNSGIKLHEAYEIQILESYQSASSPKTQAGAVYKQHAPLVNACRKPGEWQAFDIVFRAPRFDPPSGKDNRLVRPGTFTVFHNGVLIHDKVKILGRTNSSEPPRPELRQPFFLQDHGAAVGFRNIWLRELEPDAETASAEPFPDWKASGKRGAVAAGGRGAVEAGLEVLKAGGNASDAAVATILALSVTDATAFCFGGEVPILVYDAKRKVVEAISGQGAAPRLATRERFAAMGGIPARGLEPAAVPAALDACLTVLERHGTITFAEAAAPALRLLDKGDKPWHADLARTWRRLIDAERSAAGERRRGLRLVADYFYRGPVAREIAAWCEKNGGLLRFDDLATHASRIEEPVRTDYRGYTVYKCGAWTQGPWLLEALNLLEGFDLRALGRDRPEAIHVIVEAMKLAMADRDVYYADPLFEDVPVEALLSKKYAEIRRPLLDRETASLVQRPGDPRRMQPLLDSAAARAGLGGPAHDTTTCLVADADGNVVAATPSGWSGVVVEGTGVWLGTRLQSFNIWEGHPNCIEPGKRPRITLTPTLVQKDGKPVLAVSVAGGDAQDQVSLQLVIDALDLGLAPAEAIAAPRFGTDHHLGSFRQTPPRLGSLLLYEREGEKTIEAMKARGHQVSVGREPYAAPCMLTIDPISGEIKAAGDPKAGRHAAAW